MATVGPCLLLRRRASSAIGGALTLGLVWGAGCSGDEAPPEEVVEVTPAEPASPHGDHPPSGHNPHAPTAAEEPPLAQVAAGAQRGRAIDATAVLQAGTEAISLDLRDGARVEVLATSRVRLGEEASAQLFLGQGAVHVVLPPMGSSPRPPMRVGTPAGTLVVGGSGDAWVLALPDGAVWFAVTGGRAEVTDLASAPEDNNPRRIPLVAGRALVAGAEVSDGPSTEAEARAALATLANGVTGSPSAERMPNAMASLTTALEEAEASWRRGEALQAAHREAAGTEAAQETLAALVAFGQETERVRSALLFRYEVARSLALRLGDEQNVAFLRPRVRAALRLE